MDNGSRPFAADQALRRLAIGAACATLLLLAGGRAQANPSMSDDFERMMKWLSHEMVQGLAFNAGSTFDPPREVRDKRLQPDVSFGLGRMPLDKNRFPKPETQGLKDINASGIFPSAVLFPNLAMHMRMGLPWRSDLALRVADMTTPPGYKVTSTTTGKGQSNSVGFSLRKHLFGNGRPLVSLGVNYNYVFGHFDYKTKFQMEDIEGFSASNDVNGTIRWNVNSYGFNTVVSQTFGTWTPFAGFGYSYLTGSVRARLEAVADTPLILPVVGESSDHPEQSQGRLIVGAQMNRSWVNFFANGEVKAIGIGSGKSWIVHSGISLPFQIGAKGFYSAKKSAKQKLESATVYRSKNSGASKSKKQQSDLIFIR